MSVAGTYDCVTRTPLGEQRGVLTVIPSPDGSTFTGSLSNDTIGSIEVRDATIDGDTLAWTMRMTAPIPMNLECEATVEGDRMTGEVKAGAFGAMEITGQRRA